MALKGNSRQVQRAPVKNTNQWLKATIPTNTGNTALYCRIVFLATFHINSSIILETGVKQIASTAPAVICLCVSNIENTLIATKQLAVLQGQTCIYLWAVLPDNNEEVSCYDKKYHINLTYIYKQLTTVYFVL